MCLYYNCPHDHGSHTPASLNITSASPSLHRANLPALRRACRMTLLQLVRQALCLTVSIEVAKTDDNGRLIIPHRFREVWIDVGANDGLEWPKPWPSDVFVLAFEPLLDKYSRQLARFSTPLTYHKNAVALGHFDSQGIILPFAISSEEGNATFHVQALDLNPVHHACARAQDSHAGSLVTS